MINNRLISRFLLITVYLKCLSKAKDAEYYVYTEQIASKKVR